MVVAFVQLFEMSTKNKIIVIQRFENSEFISGKYADIIFELIAISQIQRHSPSCMNITQ